MSASVTVAPGSVSRAWHVVHTVLDPEVPALSICDLGIVRDIREREGALEVDLTPTYSGCPATEAIERAVIEALEGAGLGPVVVRTVLAPAWTSDWISEEGRRKLKVYGIAPPGRCGEQTAEQVVRFVTRPSTSSGRTGGREVVACPRCDSTDTERLSAFGSTACKALYRCLACREPFEAFKAI